VEPTEQPSDVDVPVAEAKKRAEPPIPDVKETSARPATARPSPAPSRTGGARTGSARYDFFKKPALGWALAPLGLYAYFLPAPVLILAGLLAYRLDILGTEAKPTEDRVDRAFSTLFAFAVFGLPAFLIAGGTGYLLCMIFSDGTPLRLVFLVGLAVAVATVHSLTWLGISPKAVPILMIPLSLVIGIVLVFSGIDALTWWPFAGKDLMSAYPVP
jgi:hypothetical protein